MFVDEPGSWSFKYYLLNVEVLNILVINWLWRVQQENGDITSNQIAVEWIYRSCDSPTNICVKVSQFSWSDWQKQQFHVFIAWYTIALCWYKISAQPRRECKNNDSDGVKQIGLSKPHWLQFLKHKKKTTVFYSYTYWDTRRCWYSNILTYNRPSYVYT